MEEMTVAQEYRAADLPEGSVVADAGMAYIKGRDEWWYGTGLTRHYPYPNPEIDGRLADGANVLRVGNGQEG